MELQHLDEIACKFEFQRLSGMGVLTQVEGPLPGHRTLSTKFVLSWRLKGFGWLRRARLVAREFNFLDPGRTGLYSPASSSLVTRLIPALFMANRQRGWAMISLDVADAYLTVSQGAPTVSSVRLTTGEVVWLKLEKCLPGQRDGSARWFHDFQDILMNKCHVQPLPEMPSLFRMPPDVASTDAGGDGFDLFEPPSVASGGGLMHVDDLLATAHVDTLKDMVEVLSSKYKINAQWVCQVGDSLTFLKRRHKLISETELEIQVPGRHIEKLMELCGLKSSKNRPRKTPLPSGRLPTDDENDPELDVARASTFRSATGILLYLQSDCIASQFGIRFLAGYMSRPTEGS